jgi:hypothetical protein
LHAAWIRSAYVNWWASGLATLSSLAIGVATLVAVARSGRERFRWLGFATFGIIHVILNKYDSSASLLDNLVQWGLERFVSSNQSASADDLFIISHPIVTIAYAIIGFGVGACVHSTEQRGRP